MSFTVYSIENGFNNGLIRKSIARNRSKPDRPKESLLSAHNSRRDIVCFSGENSHSPSSVNSETATPSSIKPFKIKSTPAPFLIPKHIATNIAGVFNPGAIEDPRGGFHLLARVVRGYDYPEKSFMSILYHIHCLDRYLTDSEPQLVIEPNERFPWGFEDPRIVKIGREYLVVATGYDGKCPQICLFTTTNLGDPKQYNYRGIIGPKGVDDKDAFFLPEKVKRDGKDKYMFFHRISETGNIQYLFVEDIKELTDEDGTFWKKHLEPAELENHTLLKRSLEESSWEHKIGGGPPPLKTDEGWLLLYHGVSGKNTEYRMGAALLDKDDPTRVIARSPDPIMEPTKLYETDGRVPNVIFPTANIVVPDPKEDNNPYLCIFHGAADKNIGLASVKLKELLAYLKQFDAQGNLSPAGEE